MRKIKRKFLNYLVKRLFNALTEDDALVVSGKNVIIGGEKVNDSVRGEISSGARALLSMSFWKLLTRELEIAANRRIYQHSTKDDDIVFGKAMLYNLDLMKKKVENLSQL